MPRDTTTTAFREAFLARTKRARIAAGLTQQEMATLLGIDQPKYNKYETRSLLPHEHVETFCIAARIDPSWLFSGKGKGPVEMRPVQEPEVKKPGRKRKAA